MKTYNNLLGAGMAMLMAMAAWLPSAVTVADEPMKPMKGGEHQSMLPTGENGKQDADAGPAGGKMMIDGKMMEHCQAMKEQKQKMKDDMKAQDAELTEQLSQMNSAPEDKKIGLMAAVFTKMVEQRITMDGRKAKMEEEMMKHMMQHMQMGKESMSQCPMMKGMKRMDGKSAGTHTAHQLEQK
jgi:hypothetical protein